jgi:succinate dehydrogenase/fumarate reductase flavoprotein subunit
MWENAGIFRSREKIKQGLQNINQIIEEADLLYREKVTKENIENKNLAEISKLVLQAAYTRQESRGTHNMAEYPYRDDENWLKHISFTRKIKKINHHSNT